MKRNVHVDVFPRKDSAVVAMVEPFRMKALAAFREGADALDGVIYLLNRSQRCLRGRLLDRQENRNRFAIKMN